MAMDFKAYNAKVIDEFRANGGKVADFGDSPLVILHTTGAKTGAPRETVLMYLSEGDKAVVFAAMGGAPRNPDWYYNLKANPEVTLELGAETTPAVAVEVTGEDRDRLFAEQARRSPQFAEYAKATDRTIPVVMLTRRS